jgi:hypothetical protein
MDKIASEAPINDSFMTQPHEQVASQKSLTPQENRNKDYASSV